MKIRNIAFLFLISLMVGCEDEDFGEIQQSQETFLDGEGFFIVNEGNFTQSSGSVSFYSFDSAKIYNNLFYEANNRPLGDVPQSIYVHDTTAFIVVNNSSRIEQVSLKTFGAKSSITGFKSPREMQFLNDDIAYVSDLYSDSLAVIDLNAKTRIGSIDIGRSSQAMVEASGKIFVANWSQLNHPEIENNKVMIINPDNHEVVDSVKVAKEPNSMKVDQNNNVWVLSGGGYSGDEYPVLQCIDSQKLDVIKTLQFDSKQRNPSELAININRDTLFYLNSGVYKMSITADELPTDPFVAENNRLFYALGLANGHVIVSDAINYRQKGIVYLYSKAGIKIDSVRAGIIPGFFCEK